MTEEEWSASEEIDSILGCIIETLLPEAQPSNWGRLERKKRLLVAGFLREVVDRLPPGLTHLCEVWEQYADGSDITDTVRTRLDEVERAGGELSQLLFSIGYDDIALVSSYIAEIRAGSIQTDETGSERNSVTGKHVRLIRDIFGNPFRPAAFDSRWRTSDVVGLARAIYDDKAFERMPILADALMDAGCEDE